MTDDWADILVALLESGARFLVVGADPAGRWTSCDRNRPCQSSMPIPEATYMAESMNTAKRTKGMSVIAAAPASLPKK